MVYLDAIHMNTWSGW